MSDSLLVALATGGGVTAIIGAAARYLPRSRNEQLERADTLTDKAIARLEAENTALTVQVKESRREMAEFREWTEQRVLELEERHRSDLAQHDRDRNRIFELEQHVASLTRDLAASEKTVAGMQRDNTARTRQGDPNLRKDGP